MFKNALDHFKNVDSKLYNAASQMEISLPEKSTDYFVSLTREIIGQQLSGNVARVIYARFEQLFKNKQPTPEQISKIDEQKLRDVGMAWAKVRSLKDLAAKVHNGEVHLDQLDGLDNEAVVLELTKVKGIGPWTAEMFLMFALSREDVFSPGDLGLRNGIVKLYKLSEKPTPEQLLEISNKWQPYRTYASLVLWNYLDNFNPLV